jgi:hypothetical protein
MSLCLGVLSILAVVFPPDMEIGSYVEEMRKEVPSFVCTDSVTIANLNLNGQGNVIVVRPGERIYSIVNLSYNPDVIDDHELNQLIIGYKDIGAKKCIFSEMGYRCAGQMIQDFWLEAPLTPGVYDVQGFLEQGSSRKEAMQQWDNRDHYKVTVGRVIVMD